MGGIPFKSAGCNTCRRRKVKCDETKPECLRCVKNGHVCTGYERQRVFIHKSSSTIGGDSQKAVVQRPKNTVARNMKPPPGTIIQVGPSIPQFNARPEIRSQLLASFIDCYIPSAQYLQNGPNRNMFQTLPDLVGSSPLLDKAIASLSSAFVGKQNQDDRLLQYSTKLYGQAMEILQGKIKLGRSFGKDLLYTTVLFQVYELINCSPSGFPAWLAHVQGSNALIRQCDSRNEVTAAENLFLRQLRFVILCDAVGQRKSASHYNIPSRPESRPGSTFKPEPMDEFLDILVECSTLLEKVDHFLDHGQEGPEQPRRAGKRLLYSCLSLEERLHDACIEMQAKLGVASPLPHDDHILEEFRTTVPKDFFPEPLRFPSLTCAESHLMYWTILVLVYPLIDRLFDFLGTSESPAPSMPMPGCYPSIEEETSTGYPTPDLQTSVDFLALTDVYATEICRSGAYCLQPDMKSLGGQMLLAPLSQSTQFFQVQQSTEKAKWCQTVFMRLPQMGFGIGLFLKDMVWPQYRSSQRKRSPTPSTPSEPDDMVTVRTAAEFFNGNCLDNAYLTEYK